MEKIRIGSLWLPGWGQTEGDGPEARRALGLLLQPTRGQDGGGMDHSHNTGDTKEKANAWYIFKVEFIGFADCLDVRYKRIWEIKDDSTGFGLITETSL